MLIDDPMDSIKMMHEKFDMEYDGPPRRLPVGERDHRIAAMQEELDEYAAVPHSVTGAANNLLTEYDSLVDLLVFLLGTFHKQGLNPWPAFIAVMEANMRKERGSNPDKVRSQYGGPDLRKPAGWVGPEKELLDILGNTHMHWHMQQEPEPIEPVEGTTPQAGVASARWDPSFDSLKKSFMTASPWPRAGKYKPSRVGPYPPPPLRPPEDELPENEMKYDSDALPVQLLPTIPLLAIARVFGYGAKKYAANSWRRPDKKAVAWSRTYGSIMRHLLLWNHCQEDDPESGLNHLWHAGTQLMILIEHVETGAGTDDRHKPAGEEE